MRAAGLLALCLLCGPRPVAGGEIPVTGRVTYLSAGVIYTSLGRDHGVRDSVLLRVLAGRDTAAVLRVFALSSQSSACSLISGRTDISIGATVTASVPLPDPPVSVAAGVATPENPTPRDGKSDTSGEGPGRVERPTTFNIKGRISAQFRMLRYDAGEFDLNQPGFVVNLQARAGGIPLFADLYANLRTASYGNSALFGRHAIDQSRIYRAALSYDAASTRLVIGRTGVPGMPAVGIVDGGVVEQRLHGWTIGAAFGLQPDLTSRGVSTDYTKAVVFGAFEFQGMPRGVVSAAYARVHFGSVLDRESVLGGLALALSPSLSLYGNAEVDLRRKTGQEFVLHPSLSSLYAQVSYRALSFLSLGLGSDAARPVYSFAAVRSLPDSLLERALSWGASFMIGLQMAGGVMLSNTTTLRPGDSRRGREYADYATLSVTDVAGTGLTLRANLNASRTAYTSTLAYGGGIQKTLFSLVDLSLRHQRYEYRISRSGSENKSSTTGVDAIVPIGSGVALFGSYEWTAGYGSDFRSLFAELSVRF